MFLFILFFTLPLVLIAYVHSVKYLNILMFLGISLNMNYFLRLGTSSFFILGDAEEVSSLYGINSTSQR